MRGYKRVHGCGKKGSYDQIKIEGSGCKRASRAFEMLAYAGSKKRGEEQAAINVKRSSLWVRWSGVQSQFLCLLLLNLGKRLDFRSLTLIICVMRIIRINLPHGVTVRV